MIQQGFHQERACLPSFSCLLALSWQEESAFLFVPFQCTCASLAYKQYPQVAFSAEEVPPALRRAAPPRDGRVSGP